MKKLIAIASIIAGLGALVASAQQGVPSYTPTTVSLPTIPANTTSNLASAALIYCGHQQNMAFQWTPYVLTNSNVPGTNGYVNYLMAPTVDYIHPDTNHTFWVSVPMAAAGTAGGPTNNAIFTTNMNSYGYGGWYILTISNTETNNGWVVSPLTFGTKQSAP
jgi:hypothetical protein